MGIRGKITSDFDTYATTVDPMYMHEYGHMIDSRRFVAVGIPSANSANNSSAIVGDPNNLWTHDIFWTELRANKRAKKYFEKHYGVNWNDPLFNYYPINY